MPVYHSITNIQFYQCQYVEYISPLITIAAIGQFTSAPDPVENAIGIIPGIANIAFINIGFSMEIVPDIIRL